MCKQDPQWMENHWKRLWSHIIGLQIVSYTFRVEYMLLPTLRCSPHASSLTDLHAALTHPNPGVTESVQIRRVGQNHIYMADWLYIYTIYYLRCIYGNFGREITKCTPKIPWQCKVGHQCIHKVNIQLISREITKYTVTYGNIRFWPTLQTSTSEFNSKDNHSILLP